MTQTLTAVRRTAVTLAVAGLGAAAFSLFGLPLPFLLGPVTATALLQLKTPTLIPDPLRDAALLALGVHIGSSLTPSAAARLGELPLAVIALLLATAGAMAVGYAVYRRLAGWSRETAFLASSPGALSAVLALTDAKHVDAGQVTLAHSLRLCALVFLFPIAFPAPEVTPSIAAYDLADGIKVTLAGVLAGGVLAWRRAPAAWVLGPAASTATLSATGLVTGALPPLALAAAFLSIGALAGGRIGAAPPRAWRRDAWAAGTAFVAMMAVSAAAALLTAQLLGLPAGATLLAFAPGGFEAMVALAAALDLDPAFVGAAHVLRVLALTVGMPWAHAVFIGRRRGAG